ncbi:MAG: nitroreductase family protein, partial [Thermoplasmatota archaeon]
INNNISYYTVDVAIAMEHIVLAATDKGLGTCWVGSFDEEKLKTILQIPPRIRIIAYTPLGYPKEKQTITGKSRTFFARSTKRKTLSEISHYNTW